MHAAERCAQSASCDFQDEPASTAEWPERERPEANASAIHQPRQEEQGCDEREPERHRNERDTEAGLSDRREVAVQQPVEGQLQGVLRAQDEGDDADVDRRDHADTGDDEEALPRSRRKRFAQDK
jgi:hypothetical protein